MKACSADAWIGSGQYLHTERDGKVFYRDRGDGAPVVMLHGFPTWSYEWAPVATALETTHRTILLDFPGYGASDKHTTKTHRVGDSADTVEQLLRHLHVDACHLVVHDYGSIVGQELLDRRRRGAFECRLRSLTVLNASVFAGAYKPTMLQRVLLTPIAGAMLGRFVRPGLVRRGLDRARARPLDDEEFEQLAHGMWRQRGHTRSHQLLSYVAERREHGPRWEEALESFDGPLQLIWGLCDPVSGRGALDLARARLPHARIEALDDAGHFPHAEDPQSVYDILRRFFQDC